MVYGGLCNFVPMKKLVAQVIILLFIALAGGYSRLYAYTAVMMQNTTVATQAINSDDTFTTSATTLDNSIKTALTPTEKPVEKIDPTDTEDEEDELNAYKALSFKKLAGVSGMLIPAHAALIPQADIHTRIYTNSLHARGHFLYVPSGKWYICFGVFRI